MALLQHWKIVSCLFVFFEYISVLDSYLNTQVYNHEIEVKFDFGKINQLLWVMALFQLRKIVFF